jgi:hypothetical protein
VWVSTTAGHAAAIEDAQRHMAEKEALIASLQADHARAIERLQAEVRKE